MADVRQRLPLQPDARVPRVSAAAVDRDLCADLVAPLAALRRRGRDGYAAAAVVVLLDDGTRARLVREMVRRPALFGAPVVRAVLASTPKVTLGRVMGAQAAAVAWRCYVVEA